MTSRVGLVRVVSLVSTVVLCWGALSFGRADSGDGLVVGALASRDYSAVRDENVVDPEQTRRKQEEAAATVETVFQRLVETERSITGSVAELMEAVGAAVVVDGPSGVERIPEPAAEASTTDSTTEQTTAVLGGRVFFDVDDDGILEDVEFDSYRPDFGLGGVGVAAFNDQVVIRGVTNPDGTFSLEVPGSVLTVSFDLDGGDLPPGVVVSQGTREVDCRGVSECGADSLIAAAAFADSDDVVFDISQKLRIVDSETVLTLADLARRDFVARVSGSQEVPLLDQVRFAIEQWLQDEFRAGITQESLIETRGSLVTNPPLLGPGFPGDLQEASKQAAAGVIDAYLVPNMVEDPEATEAARQKKIEEVEPVSVLIRRGELLVRQGEPFSEFDIAAIRQTGAAEGDSVPELALGTVLAVLVGVLGYYLARFRSQFWQRPKMVALFGMLLVMGALAVRGALAAEARDLPIYTLPAVAFGYLAAVLFDNRMGTLMAIAMAVLTAAGTQEVGITIYALLATLAPIGFVSSASTRHAYRNSVVVSAALASVIAAATSWSFYADPDGSPWRVVGGSAAWGFAVSLAAALLIQPVLAWLEAWFDITTTLRLLDLTDRNHAALQLLQEKAFGSFNHSLMVGTLADAAARAIGANNLLARAAAYYHDLGKTENPLYFIENQFGISNPHDDLTPVESAGVIRQHVIDGLVLARQYRIPTEVMEGILTHHGDGVMRYFYEKARAGGETAVDIDDFRHVGHKPTSREMAIVMMADAVEGACRAAFRDEDPVPDVIFKVINRVIDEKVGDGQLSECDLTLGELTKVRAAFLDALVGHYHQRIAYPNFPGS